MPPGSPVRAAVCGRIGPWASRPLWRALTGVPRARPALRGRRLRTAVRRVPHPVGGWVVLAPDGGSGPSRGRAPQRPPPAAVRRCSASTSPSRPAAVLLDGAPGRSRPDRRRRPDPAVIWTAGSVLAFAIKGGWRWAARLHRRSPPPTWSSAASRAATHGHNIVLLIWVAGIAIGYVVEVARACERTLARALEIEAATRERERLARDIHDGVLQVLAMVQRRGSGRPAARPPSSAGWPASRRSRCAPWSPAAWPRPRSGCGPATVDPSPTRAGDDAAAAGRRPARPARPVRGDRSRSPSPAPPCCWPRAPPRAGRRGRCRPGQRRRARGRGGPRLDPGRGRAGRGRRHRPGRRPRHPRGAARRGRAARGGSGSPCRSAGRLRDLGGTRRADLAPGQGTEVELTVPRTHGRKAGQR